MGTFGTGCCTGGNKFAGNVGWKPPKQGAEAPKSTCDPAAAWDPNDLSFDPTGLNWPKWVKDSGCSIISILTLNEKNFDLTDVLTPENVEKMADCIDECLKRTEPFWWRNTKKGVRDGLHDIEGKCLNECKEKLMEEEYSIVTDLSTYVTLDEESEAATPPLRRPYWDPSAVLSSLCPPLCVGQEVVIGYETSYKCWTNTGWGWSEPWWSLIGHRVQCKIITCTPLGEIAMCFECIDRSPQLPDTSIMCIDSDGKIIHRDSKDRPWLGQPGSCNKKRKDPAYRGFVAPGFIRNSTSTEFCCEYCYVPAPGWREHSYVRSLTTEVPCPDADK